MYLGRGGYARPGSGPAPSRESSSLNRRPTQTFYVPPMVRQFHGISTPTAPPPTDAARIAPQFQNAAPIREGYTVAPRQVIPPSPAELKQKPAEFVQKPAEKPKPVEQSSADDDMRNVIVEILKCERFINALRRNNRFDLLEDLNKAARDVSKNM